MDKNFKSKINTNRNKNFGMGNTFYSPRTSKPRPITYERYFDGLDSYNTALCAIANDVEELKDFIDYIYFDSTEYSDNYFDQSIYHVAKYMAEITPALQSKQYIHTKFALNVNGFTVRLENNITLDIRCKYEINDGVANIIGTSVSLTTHSKISKDSYVNLTGEDSEWKKKEFVKKFNNNRHQREEKLIEED